LFCRTNGSQVRRSSGDRDAGALARYLKP